MKIALIGPTFPFRGGISHYTTLLYRAMRKKHDVKFISFKRQYPKMLFPGKSDRDTSKNPLRADGVEYLIDSMNPFTWIAASRAIADFHPDKVVFPWWVAFWAPQFLTIIKLVKIKQQAEIVFICHNVAEHEDNFIKKAVSRLVLSSADMLITHSKEETRKLKDLIGEKVKVKTGFHPTYSDLSKERFSKEQAKEKLGLAGNVLLFFGFVREYKGLRILLTAMPNILKEKEVSLLVVGEFWKDKQKYLDMISSLNIAAKVKIVDEYVPNESISVYFSAADLVVQPYLTVSGSGITQLSYGQDRPVIATNIGCLPEVIEDGVNGRLVEPGNPAALAKAVLESLDPSTLKALTANAVKTKERFSWEKMAEIVLER